MRFSDPNKVDPFLTKLRTSEGKHIPPRSASKPFSPTTNDDLLSRSKQRRDYLQSSYNELQRYARHDLVERKPETNPEERGTSYRTRKLWDFDSTDDEGPSPPLSVTRYTTEDTKEVWTAKDIRREARQSVTRQVQKDLIEMEHFNEGMKKRISKYGQVSKKDENTGVRDERRESGSEKDNGNDLSLSLSNEENRNRNIVDDGYGKVVSPRPMASRSQRKVYRGINSEVEPARDNSEEYVSISETRLQRIRELNKQNYEGRALRYSDGDLGSQGSNAKSTSNNEADEIMPPPPRYLQIIKEKSHLESEYDARRTRSDVTSARPPFSPPTEASSKARAYTKSLSPPRRPLTSFKMQFSTPPPNQEYNTINGPQMELSSPPTKFDPNPSPSSFYVSTRESDAISIRSGLSEGTPCDSTGSKQVAQGTLSVILGRIDDAKENFKKALLEDDVKKQAELASLITRLGEAAVAMRKLEDL